MNLDLANNTAVYCRKSGTGSTLIVCVPGGPGFTHSYLDAFHHIFQKEKYTVISYDPTGTGESQSVPFYHTFEQYAEEFRQIVESLDFEDFYILAHSSGNCVLLDYLLKADRKPKGVIMINPILDGKEFNENLNQLAQNLPTEFHEKRNAILETGDSEAYMGLLAQYWFPYRFCRKDPWPDELNVGLAKVSMEMVSHFVGPDPLNFTGAVLNWNKKNDIDQIKIPCLAISGAHDYAPRKVIYYMGEHMPNCITLIAPNSSHTPWIEDEEIVFQKILEFVKVYEYKQLP